MIKVDDSLIIERVGLFRKNGFWLTHQEHEIITMLLNGNSTPGVAKILGNSQYTIRNILQTVYKKTSIESPRTIQKLAVYLQENGWLDSTKGN